MNYCITKNQFWAIFGQKRPFFAIFGTFNYKANYS
nr:MAG TPA: hypothetical protein [Caudoviricetes sp.]